MKSLYKKTIVLLLLVALLAIARPAPAQAGEWGGAMLAAMWKQTTEQMVKSIQDTILANMKMAAMRIVQTRLLSLLQTSSGSSSSGLSGMLISNWQSFIYSTASTSANNITNDFFKNLQAGSTSAMKQYVLNPAQNAVNQNVFSWTPDLQNYVPGGDPTKIFTSGTSDKWKGWRVAAGPQNDLGFIYLRAQALKQAEFQAKVESQKAEGLAGQGVASKKTSSSSSSSGKYGEGRYGSEGEGYGDTETITMTGSMINSMANEIQSMGVKLITQAKSIPEVVTNMVTATMTQMITQGINQAFSKIQ